MKQRDDLARGRAHDGLAFGSLRCRVRGFLREECPGAVPIANPKAPIPPLGHFHRVHPLNRTAWQLVVKTRAVPGRRVLEGSGRGASIGRYQEMPTAPVVPVTFQSAHEPSRTYVSHVPAP